MLETTDMLENACINLFSFNELEHLNFLAFTVEMVLFYQ